MKTLVSKEIVSDGMTTIIELKRRVCDGKPFIGISDKHGYNYVIIDKETLLRAVDFVKENKF